jgi:hypothetical protein
MCYYPGAVLGAWHETPLQLLLAITLASTPSGQKVVGKGQSMLSKMDERLVSEIQERRQRGTAEGKTDQELGLERYEVTIELKHTLRPPKGKTRIEAIRDLEREAQAHQASIANVLISMGVTNFQSLPLSSSIKTSLTLAQIDEIAKHPDVSIVRLIKPERVIP